MRWELRISFENREDAEALRDLIEEPCVIVKIGGAAEMRASRARIAEWPACIHLLEKMLPGRTYETQDLQEMLVAGGWRATTITGMLRAMIDAGLIERPLTNLYRKV